MLLKILSQIFLLACSEPICNNYCSSMKPRSVKRSVSVVGVVAMWHGLAWPPYGGLYNVYVHTLKYSHVGRYVKQAGFNFQVHNSFFGKQKMQFRFEKFRRRVVVDFLKDAPFPIGQLTGEAKIPSTSSTS